jgi:hypothetical protein
MECPKCQFDNREGVKYCERCGTKLELVCPKCRTVLSLDTRFCGQCGEKLIPIQKTTDVTSASLLKVPLFTQVAVALGSIMILASLALPWYSGHIFDWDVRGLLSVANWADHEDLLGLALPVVFVIVFASFGLLSVFWSLLRVEPGGRFWMKFWMCTGILTIVCLLLNSIYASLWLSRPFGYDFESGFVLALVGTITVLGGAVLGRAKAS